jgi:serine/threonine-protein kinase
VFLAADLLRSRPVVVKQLTDDAMANDELRRRFLSEAETLAGLSHPNIVRVLDYGASLDERPFLVMEPLRGETLGALLARRPHQPVELSLMIVTEAAKGLAAAHEQQVFHRDVKPDNLFLLGPRGAPTGVKVIDFGMAKLPRSNGSSGVHTVLGTIEYMAPEQVMADPVDARTDVYGLGILLFRLLTAHLPFEAPLGLDLLSHQLFSPVPPASWLNDELDPRLERVVMRATRKHPDNRHATMAELLADLEWARRDAASDPPAESPVLRVDPDVYEPRNPKGREVAELLAARYQTIAPAAYLSAQEAALSLMNFRTSPPGSLDCPEPEPSSALDSGLVESPKRDA